MTVQLPRPRHGDPIRTTEELRALAAAVLEDDVQTLARTTAYLRRSYRVVFLGYVAMLLFGMAAVVSAFVRGLTAASTTQAIVAAALAGLTVGIFVAFCSGRLRRGSATRSTCRGSRSCSRRSGRGSCTWTTPRRWTRSSAGLRRRHPTS